MSNKFMTVIYDVSQPEMKEKAKKLLADADWTAAGWSHAFADRDEARAELYRLQESSAAAPQVVADERKLPPLPQYFPDIVNIRADEELRAQDYATQYARAALQAAPVHAQELSDATIINAANKYGISPHAAMPFVRELIASQSTTQEIRAVANPVEFDGIKTDAVQAQEPEHVPVRPGHFPQRDPSKPAEQQGVFKKFDVWRTDGSSAPGGKHRECRYFVLDVDHDALAKPALQAYAAACAVTHPDLSADMVKRFDLAPAQPVAVPDGPSAEDYSDMLRAFFFHYAAGGYNDEGGLVPLETVKDKLEWIVNEAIQHAAPAAQGDAKGEYFLIEKDGRHYNFFADTETVDLLTRNGYKVIPAAAIAAKAAA